MCRSSLSLPHVQVQRRRMVRLPGSLKKKAVSVVPAQLCACAFIDEFRYVKDDEKYILYEEGQLADSCLRRV